MVATEIPKRESTAKVVGATLIGTSIEWYDFGIYVFAAAVVFPAVFFPTLEPGQGVLSGFVTLAIAAVFRPLGAAVIGHVGDTLGRKRSLILSICIMSAATVGIGLIPGYNSWGWVSIALLFTLRVAQSFAVGGEWGGAILYAVESAPPKWRAVFGAFPQIGNSLGLFLSTGVISLVSAFYGQQGFIDFGWRIPFLLSAVFAIIGIWLRLTIVESPEFEAARKLAAENTDATLKQAAPLRELFQHHSGKVFQSAGAFFVTIGGLYISLSYVEGYGAN